MLKPQLLQHSPGASSKWLKLTFLLLFLLQTSGCIVGPDFVTPNAPILQPDFVAKQNFHSAEIELSQWWQSFNDPKLNQLLAQAQAQNLPLLEAYERITQARANLRLQGGQLKPNADLIGGYSFEKNSPNSRPFVGSNGDPFNLFELGFDTSWELDLFGRLKRNIEAADAEVEFQANEYEFVRQTLMADIVSNYLRIRLLQSQVQLTQESLMIQTETSTLVNGRREAGVSTALDQHQTDSFRFRTEALLASLRQQIEVEFNQLGVLMGQTPNFDLRQFVSIMPIPEIPPVPAVGLPADLLRRRPDLWRDEWAVKAASARIGVAEADLYPQLTLLGTISLTAQNVSGLFETDGLEFSVGPSFRWNILHFNRINNNIEIQHSLTRQAILRYQNTALTAVREVEDALVNHQGFLEQWQAFNRAVTADQSAVTLSLERYRAGKANFQRVLDAQQQLLDDRTQGFDAQAQAIIQLVRLYKAAGGGWPINGGAACNSCVQVQPVIVTQPVVISGQPIVSEQPVVIGQPTFVNQQPVISGLPQVVSGPVIDNGRYPLLSTEAPVQHQVIQNSGPSTNVFPTATPNSSPTLLPAHAYPQEIEPLEDPLSQTQSVIEIPLSQANIDNPGPPMGSFEPQQPQSTDLEIDSNLLFGDIEDFGVN